MIKISEIVNDIYETCILNEWNGYYFFVKSFIKSYPTNKYLDEIESNSEFRKTDYIQDKNIIK